MSSTALFRRFATAAAMSLAALGATSTAQARTDVTVSIGIQVPGGRMHRAPVYVPPPRVYGHPVYVQPAPVYLQTRPVFVQQPVYIRYSQHPGWHRGKWHSKHGHGNRGYFNDRNDRGDRDGRRH